MQESVPSHETRFPKDHPSEAVQIMEWDPEVEVWRQRRGQWKRVKMKKELKR